LPAGELLGGTERSVDTLRRRHSKDTVDKANHRSGNRKTPHKYPIAMWKMVADVMAGLPDQTVRLLSNVVLKLMRCAKVQLLK
jgi:hypothetical protein